MFEVSGNIESYKSDLQELINQFELDNYNIFISCKNEKECEVLVKFNDYEFLYKYDAVFCDDKLLFDRLLKHNVKSSLYKTLSKKCNKKLAWGSLTGVRPARLVYNSIAKNNSNVKDAVDIIKKQYFISPKKSDLLLKVVENQVKVVKNDDSYCFYVHIPICPTRCVYCSFVSTDFAHAHLYLDKYVEYLRQEIDFIIDLIKQKNIKINSIYVGGGTPTVMSAEQLQYVLKPLKDLKVSEFTVECGRADTITEQKLKVLNDLKVSRISINPQTFNDKVLENIGRKHTAIQVIEAFNLARKFSFDINMDFIAGLPGDNLANFKSSIDKAIRLVPENITIHTLSIKNAGLLKHMNNAELSTAVTVQKMLDYASKKLKENNYEPYYLYRQKNMLGFFENVGYSKPEKYCLFNIYSMEDLKPVIACGAGAISKKIHKQNNYIERIANVKQISDYISRFDEMLKRKKDLLS